MTNPLQPARDEIAEQAYLRSIDPVPGAQIEHEANHVVEAVKALSLAREHVRVAMDGEVLAAREQEYVEARSSLLAAALILVVGLNEEMGVQA